VTNAVFERAIRVPFSACDPAGIMFFPQVFLLFQDHVERWITDALGISYAGLLGPRRVGLPSVRWETDFRAISRMGDDIVTRLSVERLGEKSLTLRFAIVGADGVRVEARQVIVCTSLDTHRSMPFPDDLRAAITRFQESSV
jgi:4-hydroxybenzoyl-CoA thioesterase